MARYRTTTAPNAKPMVCIDCGLRILATLEQAKRHGWALWVGGGRCKRCGSPSQADRSRLDVAREELAALRDDGPDGIDDRAREDWRSNERDLVEEIARLSANR